MAEYQQYCPVARAAEIVADRWTPLILRELLAGSRHFNAIERGLPGISRSLLVARLRSLEDAGVLIRRTGSRRNIVLTVEGLPALAREFPSWLMWSPMAHHVRVERDRPRTGRLGARGING